MPGYLQKILYTAEAVVEDGREGHARSLDGRLVVYLSVPEETGGSAEPGTNPEQLFAVGYAACFQSALLSVASGQKLDASESQIICQVGFGPTGHGGFGLTLALDLHAPFLTREQGADLMARAHERCPYSHATCGNIDVALSVDGVPQDRGEAAVHLVRDEPGTGSPICPRHDRSAKEQSMTQTAAQQATQPPPPLITAGDVMRSPLTAAATYDHAAAAAYLMKHAGATALMVVDAQTGQPKGILTEADIAHAVADGKDLNEVRIRELMTIRPTVINPSTPIGDAAQIMTRGHFRHLPVCGDSGLIGIIDITDICRALINPDIARQPTADAARARAV